MLAKRFIDQSSISDDYEELMLFKLQQICGREYTSKLRRIYQDTLLSRDLTEQYRISNQDKDMTKMDFSIQIFSSNCWPFSIQQNIRLPIELKSTLNHFTEFYNHRYHRRKLQWLDEHSKGEIEGRFSSEKYRFQVSTYHLSILLLFNQSLVWTVEQLQDQTQMDDDRLDEVLQSLLKIQILFCENQSIRKFEKNSSIRLAIDFKSNKRRIHIPLQSIQKTKTIEKVQEQIDNDRKPVIQVAIVRIMKGRQTLEYSFLIQTVIEQLSSTFRPDISLIKKCIDLLIEKEYLQRDSNDKQLLHYLN